MDDLVTLGRAYGPRGEVVLRRRGDHGAAVFELVVNGVFAMDSRQTSSEEAFADLPVDWVGARVLVGGLGLGYTALALLGRGVRELDIAGSNRRWSTGPGKAWSPA